MYKSTHLSKIMQICYNHKQMQKAWVQKGFTIVELLIVIVIISILTAITILTYNGVRNKSFDASIQTDLRSIAAGLKTYKLTVGTYPPTDTQIGTLADNSGTVVQAAIPKISHDGYTLTDQSNTTDTYARNLLICVRSGGSDPEFGIAALSLSGSVWFYQSTTGQVTKATQAWIGADQTECPYLGFATTDPGYAHWFAYKRAASTTDLNAGWLNWAAY